MEHLSRSDTSAHSQSSICTEPDDIEVGCPPADRRVSERRRRWRPVLIDRRRGFDRRAPLADSRDARRAGALLRFLRDNPAALAGLLVVANVLGLFDLLFTLNALHLGAVEMNPLLRALFSENIWLASGVKLALVLWASLLIWRFREYRVVLEAALLLIVVFAGLFVYHIYWGLQL